MRFLRFNSARKRLAAASFPMGEVFHRLTDSAIEAEWLVRLYYAASVLICARMLPANDGLAGSAVAWDFLWPLAWVEGLRIKDTLSILTMMCFIGSLVAFQFHRNVAARAVFSLLFLMAATVPNSLGGINHPYHAWFWTSFIFIFLPAGDVSTFDRAGRLSYLTVIRAAQAMFLLFYSMTGSWKLFFGTFDALVHAAGNFFPGALPATLADRVLETGTDPLLADFVINNQWLAWPMFLALIYIQVVSLVVAFRPRLHVLWGYLHIAFHLGTWLLMQIIFIEHIFLLLVLLVLSPQRAAFRSLPEALGDLPLLGGFFRRAFVRTKEPAVLTGEA